MTMPNLTCIWSTMLHECFEYFEVKNKKAVNLIWGKLL